MDVEDDGSVFIGEPSLDVVVVKEETPQGAIAALVAHEPSLVLIPKPAMDGARGGVMREAVASFLEQHRAHVLIVPDSGPTVASRTASSRTRTCSSCSTVKA